MKQGGVSVTLTWEGLTAEAVRPVSQAILLVLNVLLVTMDTRTAEDAAALNLVSQRSTAIHTLEDVIANQMSREVHVTPVKPTTNRSRTAFQT